MDIIPNKVRCDSILTLEPELPGPEGVYLVRVRSGSGEEAAIRVLKGE